MKGTPRKQTRSAKGNRPLIIAIIVAGVIVAATVVVAPRAGQRGARPIDDEGREADRHYIAGLSAYRQHDWRRAIMNFQAALSYEPDHFDAREHLDLSRAEERVQQTLERAREAFEAGRRDEAIALVATIPESSIYAAQAAELRRRVQASLNE